jgi:hypothetical protein
MPLRVYCYQYGSYWRFTPELFLKFLNYYIAHPTQGWDLSKWGKILTGKKRPRGTYKYRESRDPFSSSPEVKLFFPLDWDHGDLLNAREEMSEFMKKRGKK